MRNRRSFLRLTGGAAGAAFTAAHYGVDEVAALAQRAASGGRTPEQVAADEDFWREIQFAFTLDRTLINLNNGNSCPCPVVVREAWKRYDDWGNQSPVYHRGMTERNIETVRRKLVSRALAETGGNQLRAAKLLGITRGTLRSELRALGISVTRQVTPPEPEQS